MITDIYAVVSLDQRPVCPVILIGVSAACESAPAVCAIDVAAQESFASVVCGDRSLFFVFAVSLLHYLLNFEIIVVGNDLQFFDTLRTGFASNKIPTANLILQYAVDIACPERCISSCAESMLVNVCSELMRSASFVYHF